MRAVVLDTSVALPAILSPRGYRRRFWVLLAFGALAARRNLARIEADALLRETGTTGGLPVDLLAAQADARHRRLAEQLPPGCPDDWRLVGSRPLLQEYIRKLSEAGPKLDPALRPSKIDALRHQIESICADMTEDFDPATIPSYTADRNDDPVVHTALLADATWLIADDRKHISTDPHGLTEYELPGSEQRVSAITFNHFLEHLTDIDLDGVDPTLLSAAFEPLR